MRSAYLYPSILANLKFAFGFFWGKRTFTGPHTVMIDIEDNCDLNCIMCYFHSPLLEKKEEFKRLDFVTYKNVLKDLKRIGTKKISLCGKGEPFLHPEIRDILKLTKDMGFYVNIFTNGIHINKDFLPELSKLDQIIFSLHAGDKDTYYKVHPQAEKGSFENICFVLSQLKDFKKKYNKNTPWVKVINVVFNLNFDKIEKIFDFAERFGVNEILFKPVQLYKSQESLRMSPEQLNYLVKELKKWKNHKIKNNVPEFLAYIIKELEEKKLNKKERSFCFIPWYQGVILSSGNVVACPYNQKILGNVKEKSFSEIWFSQEYNQFRKLQDCGSCAGEAVYPYLKKFKRLFLWKIKK